MSASKPLRPDRARQSPVVFAALDRGLALCNVTAYRLRGALRYRLLITGVEIQVQVLKKGFFSPTVLAEARCNLIDGVPEDIWLPVASVNGGSSSPCTKQPSKAKTGDCPMVHLTITSEGQVVPPVVYDSKYTVISQLGSGNFGK
eukprot:gene19178-22927_t